MHILNHFVVQLKLTLYCKLAMLQVKFFRVGYFATEHFYICRFCQCHSQNCTWLFIRLLMKSYGCVCK